MTAISGASQVRRPMGIVAPQPEALNSDNIKKGQKVEVRPGEPVYLFIPTRMGSGTQLQGLNKRSPFTIKQLQGTPPGVPGVRTMGTWYQLALKPGEKAGQRDRLQLISAPVVGPNVKVKPEVKNFTLVSGNQRWY